MLLLDTHVLIWLDEGNPRLGQIALQTINEFLAIGQLGVATISFWEVAMLVEKQRLTIKTELEVWRAELLQTGLLEIPLRGTTAIRAGQLSLFHGDPADRMLVATAIENAATIMTADEKILSWDQFHPKIDARL
ncbi:MAG: twitching motility protein PilT [Deltaproteobacteria bacterium RIFOXYD12_FULL_56_24]|nr:MAG: twitching motility protein PilT [Deltaproteobacteria bacterium RIFOXYD12_FULL_56_24]